MKIEEDFKVALSQLSEKEKDKLIFRLLRKDKVLMQKLYFELVSGSTVESEREDLAQRITNQLSKPHIKRYYGDWMHEIRTLSGAITLHVKVTKDKVGEVSLNILLVKSIIDGNVDHIHKLTPKNAQKLSAYINSKLFRIVLLIEALHEDLRQEFNEELEELSSCLETSEYLMRRCIHVGFDLNWINGATLPFDLKERYKMAREMGL